jgi:hypothetical protein
MAREARMINNFTAMIPMLRFSENHRTAQSAIALRRAVKKAEAVFAVCRGSNRSAVHLCYADTGTGTSLLSSRNDMSRLRAT